MPYTNGPIFRTSNYYWKFWMKTYCRDIVCVAFQSLDTAFGLIVPHLCSQDLSVKAPDHHTYIQSEISKGKKKRGQKEDLSSVIIRTSNQIWLITTSKVIDTVNTFLMGIQCKIRIGGAKIPNLERMQDQCIISIIIKNEGN